MSLINDALKRATQTPSSPAALRPSVMCRRWNGSSTPRSCEYGRFAPLAATAMRPCSRVNRSRMRLDSLQS